MTRFMRSTHAVSARCVRQSRSSTRWISNATVLSFALGTAGCGGALEELLGNDDFARSAAAMYAEAPDVSLCRSGALTDSEKAKALAAVNDIRRIHGLSPVSYDATGDRQVMQAALMMVANGALDHNPPPTWRCYTPEGAVGAATSNLTQGGGRHARLVSTEDDILGWYTDVANAVPDNVGHRRWMLDPFLRSVSYGRVAVALGNSTGAEASALKVIGTDTSAAAETSVDYVAYPSGDFPRRYFDAAAMFSFSALFDRGSKFANARVDFSRASVSIVSETGQRLNVRGLSFDNVGYGLPNNLQFRADGVDLGKRYSVRVSGVVTPSGARDYAYSFRILP